MGVGERDALRTVAGTVVLLLRGFDQLHLAVSRAVQDHYFSLRIAEDEDVAVAEVRFLDGFFEGHGAHGDSFVGANQVHLGGLGYGGIAVHDDRHGCLFGQADGGLHGFGALRGVAVPLLHFLALARRALFGLPASFVFHGLLFQVVEGFVDGDRHVLGLGQADQRAVGRADGDLGFVAMLFDCEDHLGFESVAQDFAEFCEAGFYFFADGGSDLVVPSGVFHVHERALLEFFLDQLGTALQVRMQK